MRLDFVIPGFSKCGTTTLCALLTEHPDLFICEVKEPNFFAHKYQCGWDWYTQLYASAQPGQLCGDGSTTYSSAEFCEMACDRILNAFPEIKFIFIARSPRQRLESSYRELHHNGHKFAAYAPYTLAQSLVAFPNMLEDTRYWARINTYRQCISDDRILVLFLEEFEKHPLRELRKCFDFLGVDPNVGIHATNRRLNSADVKVYDSRLLRLLRTNRWTSQWFYWRVWKNFSPKWLTRTGLRRPFRKPIVWNSQAQQMFAEHVLDDAREFLNFYGRPESLWGLDQWSQTAVHRRAA